VTTFIKGGTAVSATGKYVIPGDPAEFAVAFLASARAPYITGSRVRVGGGLARGFSWRK
jgi:NAD(P)-dependent dehydrogenase (short-subunit alcohol dehydrogenase family)